MSRFKFSEIISVRYTKDTTYKAKKSLFSGTLRNRTRGQPQNAAEHLSHGAHVWVPREQAGRHGGKTP